MDFALNKRGLKVYAEDATKEEKYFCPCCGEEVVLKDGKINITHFAHLQDSNCVDEWTHDMSLWHRTMQNFFRPEHREVVVRRNGKVHRADILKDGVVVEFQHSPISAEEYNDRINFFTSAGYKIVWVFDVKEQYQSGQITCEDLDFLTSFRWRNPKRFLAYGPAPNKYNNVVICLNGLYTDDEINEPEDEIDLMRDCKKIVWCPTDDDELPDFRRIATRSLDTRIHENLDMNAFFWSMYDIKNIILNETLKEKSYYTVRKSDKRTGTHENNICPLTGRWFSISSCNQCKHCALIMDMVKGWGRNKEIAGWQVYCSRSECNLPDEEGFFDTPRIQSC